MIDTNRYVPFIIKHKLTQAQFLLLYLLYKDEIHHIRDYKKAFPTLDGSMIGGIPLQQLIDEGYIKSIGKGVNSDELQLTEKFTYIFVDEFEAGEQLIDLYPAFIVKDGKRYPLKLTDRNVLRKAYGKAINNNKEEHKEIIKDVNYAIENNLINGKLENFILSLAWRDIRKERLNIVDKQEEETINSKDF